MKAPPPWTQREVEHLESIAGDYPRLVVFAMHRNWLLRNRLPTRTDTAIEFAGWRRGMTFAAQGETLTPSAIARTLDITRNRVDRWLENGLIPFRRVGEYERKVVRYVRRRDVVTFAKWHPHHLHGIPAPRLTVLIEDEDLAQTIAERFPPMPRRARWVQCIETLENYPSVQRAARAVHVTPQTIFSALRSGGTAGGYHWRDVNT
jgi:hypothetical protein